MCCVRMLCGLRELGMYVGVIEMLGVKENIILFFHGGRSIKSA